MLIQPTIKLKSFQFDIFLCNERIPLVASYKYLGIHSINKLCFMEHIHRIENKIARNTGILWRLRPIVNEKTLHIIYFSCSFFFFLRLGHLGLYLLFLLTKTKIFAKLGNQSNNRCTSIYTHYSLLLQT